MTEQRAEYKIETGTRTEVYQYGFVGETCPTCGCEALRLAHFRIINIVSDDCVGHAVRRECPVPACDWQRVTAE